MATTRNPPALGEITLVDYFHESSSGHYDKSRTVKLKPDQQELIELIEMTDECDQFKGPRSEQTNIWIIEREKLIELIKANGTFRK
ncbi:MAG TPA: hypothetical protein VJ577_03485 [Burkholderiaceae bacterium]|nr:hypothetical protein [Burkholderiaceae bacterium]